MGTAYRALLLALVWLWCIAGQAWANTQPRVAVLELTGSVQPSTLSALSDKVREGVLSATDGRQVIVMSRENMAVLAKDMGLDLDCIEGACEVETGRNLGAAYVVSGGVITLEGTWITTIKIHETKGGALLASGDVKDKSALGLFDQVVPLVTRLTRDALTDLPGSGTAGVAAPGLRPSPAVAPGTLKAQQDWDF